MQLNFIYAQIVPVTIVGVVFLLDILLFPSMAEHVVDQISISRNGLWTHIEFLSVPVFMPDIYLVTAIVTFVIYLVNILWWRHYIIYPFIILIIFISLACISYDILFRLPVLNYSKLYSGAFNIIGLLIFLNFIFIILLTRKYQASHLSLFIAAVFSYFTKDALFIVDAILSFYYLGAFKIFLHFVIYVFGVFTLHLMAISVFLRYMGTERLST